MNFIFIVEQYNDLDMLTPIIWKCSTRQYINVIIVNVQPRIIPAEDFRLAFLRKSHSIQYVEIKQSYDIVTNIRMWAEKIYYKFIKKLSLPAHEVNISESDFENILIEKKKSTMVIVSYQDHNSVKIAKRWANKYNFALAINSHGITPISVPSQENLKKSSFDTIIINNNQNSFNSYPWSKDSIRIITGAPRFSKEWSNKLNEIYPKQDIPINNIVFLSIFMLSKWKDKDNKNAVISAIKAAAQIKKSMVIVKPHTRGMRFKESLPPNVLIVYDNVHSRQLIEMGNVIIFTRSSIFLDAVLLNKPIIHLAYATSANLASNSLDECKVYSQKEFIQRLAEIQHNHKTYTLEARKNCLDFYAGNEHNNQMLDTIVDKLEEVTAEKANRYNK